MSGQNIEDEVSERRVGMLAAAFLALPAVLSVVLILHHPGLHGVHGVANAAVSIHAMARVDEIVHGGLMLMYALQALGFLMFSSRLGWARPAAAAGFMAYAASVLILSIPTTLDGFVTPDIAAVCLASPAGCALADAGALRLVSIMIQDFTKVALVASSTAGFCWSIDLLLIRGLGARAAGAIGLFCAAAPIATIVLSNVYLQPSNLLAVLLPEVVWSLVVSVLMVTNMLNRHPRRRLQVSRGS